jgi:hypothetical protein
MQRAREIWQKSESMQATLSLVGLPQLLLSLITFETVALGLWFLVFELLYFELGALYLVLCTLSITSASKRQAQSSKYKVQSTKFKIKDQRPKTQNLP